MFFLYSLFFTNDLKSMKIALYLDNRVFFDQSVLKLYRSVFKRPLMFVDISRINRSTLKTGREF